jgi:hypothetical protein
MNGISHTRNNQWASNVRGNQQNPSADLRKYVECRLHRGGIHLPVTYLSVYFAPFTTPPNPGQLPPRPGNLFPQKWEDMKLAHKRGADEYTTSNNLDKVVKQQIIKAITEPIFIKHLENNISGYSRVAARAMIQFLFDSYVNITNPSTPIVYLISEIQDGVDKADAGNTPYTVNRLLTISFNHVFCTGTMHSAFERWMSLAQTNKTWANFQDIFTQSHETYESLTVLAGGYHGANMAHAGHYNAPPNAQAKSFYTETADMFASLAIAATADKYLLSMLASTNAALTGQLATKYWLIANLQAQLRNANTNTDRPTMNTNY